MRTRADVLDTTGTADGRLPDPGLSGAPTAGRRGLRAVPTVLAAATLVVAGLAGCSPFGDEESSPVGGAQGTTTAPEAPVDVARPDGPRTILLAGLDHRYADGPRSKSRSDTMLLVRLDPDAKATAMLSLPRDLRVKDLGKPGKDKLNSAWFQGGQQRLTEIIGTSVLGTPEEPFEIDQVVSVTFDAFAKIVNALGCLYSDIDRRYLVAQGSGHAAIDLPAGYQLLCGQDALSYVRYRIGDSDVIREARQATWLTEARAQVDPLKAISGGLVRKLARLVETDAASADDLLALSQLAVYVVGRPTARIQVDDLRDATDGSGDVLAKEAALRRARVRFLDPALPTQKTPVEERTGRSPVLPEFPRRLRTSVPSTLTTDVTGARAAAARVRRGARGVPVLLPDLRKGSASYDLGSTRGYRLQDPDRRPRWPSYRVVAKTANGQSYGIEGTAWRDPPILRLAGDVIRLGGRSWAVQYDGRRVHRLMWRGPKGTYWVTNTLTDDLTSREMYAIAKSLRSRGG